MNAGWSDELEAKDGAEVHPSLLVLSGDNGERTNREDKG